MRKFSKPRKHRKDFNSSFKSVLHLMTTLDGFSTIFGPVEAKLAAFSIASELEQLIFPKLEIKSYLLNFVEIFIISTLTVINFQIVLIFFFHLWFLVCQLSAEKVAKRTT